MCTVRRQQAVTMADIKKIIKRRINEYVDALDAHDFKRAANVFSTDGQLLPPNKPVYNMRQGAVAFNEDLLRKEGRPTSELVGVDDIELLAPGWAIARSFFYLIIDGKKQGLSKCLMLWKEVNGEWFCYRSMYNDEPQSRTTHTK